MCLLKTGVCFIQVHFNAFAFFANRPYACLIQGACLMEVATKTDFTVYNRFQIELEKHLSENSKLL